MDARHPVMWPWIRSAEVRGEGGLSLRELELNNYDRFVNEVVQPWKWTLLVQSGVFLTKFGHILLLSLSAQSDNM